MTQRETFKYPPIKQVAFEINFDVALTIERKIDLYQAVVRSTLPIYEPEIEASTLPEVLNSDLGKRYFVFRNKEKTKALRASSSNFNFIVEDYLNFSSYIKEVKNYATAFCKTYEIESFNRIGLRYINNLKIRKRNGVYDFSQFVKPPVVLDRVQLKDVITTFSELRFKHSDKKMTVRSGLIGQEIKIDNEENVRLYFLDLDCYTDLQSDLKDLEKNLVEFHDLIESEFLASITPAYIEYMKTGKV